MKLVSRNFTALIFTTLLLAASAQASSRGQDSSCRGLFLATPVAHPTAAHVLAPLLKKSGLNASDLRIEMHDYREASRGLKRISLTLLHLDKIPVGVISIRENRHGFFEVDLVKIENKFRFKGLGFILYSVAAVVAEKNDGILVASRMHSKDAEAIWQKMIATGVAEIRDVGIQKFQAFFGTHEDEPVSSVYYVNIYGPTVFAMRPRHRDRADVDNAIFHLVRN